MRRRLQIESGPLGGPRSHSRSPTRSRYLVGAVSNMYPVTPRSFCLTAACSYSCSWPIVSPQSSRSTRGPEGGGAKNAKSLARLRRNRRDRMMNHGFPGWARTPGFPIRGIRVIRGQLSRQGVTEGNRAQDAASAGIAVQRTAIRPWTVAHIRSPSRTHPHSIREGARRGYRACSCCRCRTNIYSGQLISPQFPEHSAFGRTLAAGALPSTAWC